MEEAALAAHANAWQPSGVENQDMDAQHQVSSRHVIQWLVAADHPTTAEGCASPPRLCSKVQSAFASTFLGTASRAHAFRFLSRASWCHRSSESCLRGSLANRRLQVASCCERSPVGTQDTSVAHLRFTSRLCHHETDREKLLSGEALMAASQCQWKKHHRKSTPCLGTEARRTNT